MPEVEIQLIAGAMTEARDQLRDWIDRLEAKDKRIRDIRYPGWAANDLGITPDPNTDNAGTYRGHPATQYVTPYPGRVLTIIYDD